MAKYSKPPPDPRGGHIRLYWELVDSNAWRCLSASDQRAYVALLRFLRSTNNGDLSLPLSVAKQHGIKSQTTLAKSLRALVAVGLLAVTRKGGCTKGGQRLPTLYRVTDQEAYCNPMKHIEASKATNDWKAMTTLGIGREAIRKADADAAAQTEAASAKKALVQKMDATGPKNGLVEPITSPKIGVWPVSPPQKMDLADRRKQAAKPMTALVPA